MKMKQKVQLGAIGASLLGNMLAGKSVIRAGDGVCSTGEDFNSA